MGPQAAATKLNISIAHAADITRSFFDTFKDVKAWMIRIKTLVHTFLFFIGVIIFF